MFTGVLVLTALTPPSGIMKRFKVIAVVRITVQILI